MRRHEGEEAGGELEEDEHAQLEGGSAGRLGKSTGDDSGNIPHLRIPNIYLFTMACGGGPTGQRTWPEQQPPPL